MVVIDSKNKVAKDGEREREREREREIKKERERERERERDMWHLKYILKNIH